MNNLLIRIWDGKQMYYPHEDKSIGLYYDYNESWILIEDDDPLDDNVLWSSKDSKFSPMLYTEFKDTEKKQIFEGDILSGLLNKFYEPINFEVIFFQGSFYLFNKKDNSHNLMGGLRREDIEIAQTPVRIIGNKYEGIKNDIQSIP